MKIWIDLANSPHPPLFAPIGAALERAGHELVLTARDNAQTVDLAREHWPDITVIGGETPAGALSKAGAIAGRMLKLRAWARAHAPDVALSHNSYAQIAAARSLHVPAITAMDYEHQPSNHLAFRLASRILLPEALPLADVARQGATSDKVRVYPGAKEEITLQGFEPDDHVLDRIGVERAAGSAVVVTRPPPSRAIYHRHGNDLYLEAMKTLGRQRHVTVVALPRHDDQRDELLALGMENLVVPDHTVDARALMYASDLVLGGGGTMTREAAVLGVPTLTAFAGVQAAMDRWLEANGAMRRLVTPRDVADVRPREGSKADLDEMQARGRRGIEAFVAAVQELGPQLSSDAVSRDATTSGAR